MANQHWALWADRHGQRRWDGPFSTAGQAWGQLQRTLDAQNAMVISGTQLSNTIAFTPPAADLASAFASAKPAETGYGPWFTATYDSDCDGVCGGRIFEGDESRSDGDGGWLAVQAVRAGRVSRQDRYVRVDGPAPPGLAKDPARNLVRAEENLKRDGRIAVPDVVHGQYQMRPYLPVIRRLYAERNLDAGREADIRDFRRTFHAAGELAMLIIDGDIAAWDLLRRESGTYRVLAGQMVPGYEDYRPGIMLEAWLLERAWRNPFVTWLDWGDGHPESLLKLK